MLRSKLSHYLDLVRRGQTIEVLDRTTPIARLVPIERTEDEDTDHVPAWLRKLEAQGIVRIGPMKGVPEIHEWIRNAKPGHTGCVEDLLEDRRNGR